MRRDAGWIAIALSLSCISFRCDKECAEPRKETCATMELMSKSRGRIYIQGKMFQIRNLSNRERLLNRQRDRD